VKQNKNIYSRIFFQLSKTMANSYNFKNFKDKKASLATVKGTVG